MAALGSLLRRLRAPRPLAGLAALALVAGGGVAATRLGGERPAGAPAPSPSATGSPRLTPAPPRTPTPSPTPAETTPPKPDRLALFRGLGAWVDVFDFKALDPARAVRDMERNGVGTLYLQTSRYRAPDDVVEPRVVGRWLDRAHDAGMKVLGWYVPGYGDMKRDIRRTMRILSFRSPRGDRFDAIGVDIEDRTEVGNGLPFNRGIVEHLRKVRSRVDGRLPVAAITPTPIGMAVFPPGWVDFPWAGIGKSSDVLMLMSYWSFRDDCPAVPLHCAGRYTAGNVARGARLTGLPVHIIGGVGDDVTTREVRNFVRSALEAEAIGGSLYDYRTTRSGYWRHLKRFNRLS